MAQAAAGQAQSVSLIKTEHLLAEAAHEQLKEAEQELANRKEDFHATQQALTALQAEAHNKQASHDTIVRHLHEVQLLPRDHGMAAPLTKPVSAY